MLHNLDGFSGTLYPKDGRWTAFTLWYKINLPGSGVQRMYVCTSKPGHAAQCTSKAKGQT